jgi:putative SOS response-associated peptidase YedK
VPAIGFYEPYKYFSGTAKTPKYSQPWYIRFKTGEPFCIAGMWDRATMNTGDVIESFTILTVRENPLIAAFHDRFPAIIDPKYYANWLDPQIQDADALRSMLEPVAPELLTAYPVSKYVDRGSPRDEQCIAPLPGYDDWLGGGWRPMNDADVERLMTEDAAYKKESAARKKAAKSLPSSPAGSSAEPDLFAE